MKCQKAIITPSPHGACLTRVIRHGEHPAARPPFLNLLHGRLDNRVDLAPRARQKVVQHIPIRPWHRLHVHQRVLMPGHVRQYAPAVRIQQRLQIVHQLRGPEMVLRVHRVHVVMADDEEVHVGFGGGEGGFEPFELGARVLEVDFAGGCAVCAGDERGGVEEDGDEIGGELAGVVGRRHLPAGGAVCVVYLDLDTAEMVVVTEDCIPGEFLQWLVAVHALEGLVEMFVVGMIHSDLVEIVAGGDYCLCMVDLCHGGGEGVCDGYLAVFAFAAPVAEDGDRDGGVDCERGVDYWGGALRGEDADG